MFGDEPLRDRRLPREKIGEWDLFLTGLGTSTLASESIFLINTLTLDFKGEEAGGVSVFPGFGFRGCLSLDKAL